MWNWIKSLFSFKKSSAVVAKIKVGHCGNHPKYKFRCPDCVEAVNG
tara:strand:+ start:279 stop:416 length:138 start_codon:yes stop_codon:yes gene_type:complete